MFAHSVTRKPSPYGLPHCRYGVVEYARWLIAHRKRLVGALGYQRFLLSKPVGGRNIALHAVPAYRALYRALCVHSRMVHFVCVHFWMVHCLCTFQNGPLSLYISEWSIVFVHFWMVHCLYISEWSIVCLYISDSPLCLYTSEWPIVFVHFRMVHCVCTFLMVYCVCILLNGPLCLYMSNGRVCTLLNGRFCVCLYISEWSIVCLYISEWSTVFVHFWIRIVYSVFVYYVCVHFRMVHGPWWIHLVCGERGRWGGRFRSFSSHLLGTDCI